jgi:hypothetical protein
VVVVQPIAQVDQNRECTQGKFSYESSADLKDVKSGHYLLQVRSMNGKSVNTLIDVP